MQCRPALGLSCEACILLACLAKSISKPRTVMLHHPCPCTAMLTVRVQLVIPCRKLTFDLHYTATSLSVQTYPCSNCCYNQMFEVCEHATHILLQAAQDLFHLPSNLVIFWRLLMCNLAHCLELLAVDLILHLLVQLHHPYDRPQYVQNLPC